MKHLLSLDHIQLAMPPGQEDRARAFYGHLLGLPEVPKATERAASGGVWFEDGALRVHLGVEANFQPARKAHPAFVVRSLDALRERLESAGYLLGADDIVQGRRRAFSHDPFGNRLEFIDSSPVINVA